MPPRRAPPNNASGSNTDLENPPTATQFQDLLRTMMEQQRLANENQARLQREANENQARLQREANENQARFQEQLAKKDEEIAQVQRQLLEVLQNRQPPQPQPDQQLGTNIVINNREHDPNLLFERFRKRGPKEFSGTEDPLAADDWLVNTEKIFDVFLCTGRQKVHLTASLFYGLADSWWQTVKEPFQRMANETAWETFKTRFTDKFIPSHVKRQKAIEF